MATYKHLTDALVRLWRHPALIAVVLCVAVPYGLLDSLILDHSRPTRILGMFLGLIISPLTTAALYFGLSRSERGYAVRIGESMAFGARNWWRVLVVNYVVGILVVIGFIIFIVPGILLSIRWSLVTPVVIFESCGVKEAMHRSALLTRSFRKTLFIGGILMWLSITVPLILAVLVFAFLGSDDVAMIDDNALLYYEFWTIVAACSWVLHVYSVSYLLWPTFIFSVYRTSISASQIKTEAVHLFPLPSIST